VSIERLAAGFVGRKQKKEFDGWVQVAIESKRKAT
jgi:hypothetical protein